MRMVALALAATSRAMGYCLPDQACWPDAGLWDGLNSSVDGGVIALGSRDFDQCYAFGTDAFRYAREGGGVCMQMLSCRHMFCDAKDAESLYQSEVSVRVRHTDDVVAVLNFANAHNISVTVKTTGHSYAGSSQYPGSVQIWMAHFEKHTQKGLAVHTDTCGQETSHAVTVGGGQNWGEVYAAAAPTRHIVGGGGLTVAAAGGWLMGSGLSSSARRYGLGIDQVLAFELVLANGSVASVDRCSHADLYWALRGGGGGAFGVVTKVVYRTHPLVPMVQVSFSIAARENLDTTDAMWKSFIEFWVRTSPTLDRRWGGYWSTSFLLLHFAGSLADAKSTFVNDLDAWLQTRPQPDQSRVTRSVYEVSSYLQLRGGVEGMTDPSKTDQTGFGTPDINIASRLISRDFVTQQPEDAVWVLQNLHVKNVGNFNYFLGGAVGDVDVADAAVHPQMRAAVWQIETIGSRPGARLLREALAAVNASKSGGAGLNHAARDEPDWRNALWGANYPRLLSIKRAVDPDNRLNCWHCIGYEGKEGPENLAASDDLSLLPRPTPMPPATPATPPPRSVCLQRNLTDCNATNPCGDAALQCFSNSSAGFGPGQGCCEMIEAAHAAAPALTAAAVVLAALVGW